MLWELIGFGSYLNQNLAFTGGIIFLVFGLVMLTLAVGWYKQSGSMVGFDTSYFLIGFSVALFLFGTVTAALLVAVFVLTVIEAISSSIKIMRE